MKTTAEYIATSSTCPRCNSSDINAGSLEVDCGSCGQEVSCENCGLSWWDEYTLKGFTLRHAPPWTPPARTPATDREALDAIFEALDGKEWDSSTTSAISEILTAAGYTVREPLLAADFGEFDAPLRGKPKVDALDPEPAPESERGKA